MTTAEHVLFLLKTRGPQTAAQVAAALALTTMGARRHLEAAAQAGLAVHEDAAGKVGRPVRTWRLSEAGHARFPDRHAELTVQLIGQVRALFGEQALARLVAAREADSEALYRAALAGTASLPQRVAALAQARAAEGYMAEAAAQDDGSMLLLENHCPICAAARICQGFCRAELDVFQRVLGPDCQVERSEHLLAGARRCAYRIIPLIAKPAAS